MRLAHSTYPAACVAQLGHELLSRHRACGNGVFNCFPQPPVHELVGWVVPTVPATVRVAELVRGGGVREWEEAAQRTQAAYLPDLRDNTSIDGPCADLPARTPARKGNRETHGVSGAQRGGCGRSTY